MTIELSPDQRPSFCDQVELLPAEFIPAEITGPFQLQKVGGGQIEEELVENCQPPPFLQSGRDWLKEKERVIIAGDYGFALKDEKGGPPWVIWPLPGDHPGCFKTFPPENEFLNILLRDKFIFSPEVRIAMLSGHMHGGKSLRAAAAVKQAAEKGLTKIAVLIPGNARPKGLESEWLLVLEEYPWVTRREAATPWEALKIAVEEQLDLTVLDETGLWFLNWISAYREKSQSEQQAAIDQYRQKFLAAIDRWLTKGQGKLILPT